MGLRGTGWAGAGVRAGIFSKAIFHNASAEYAFFINTHLGHLGCIHFYQKPPLISCNLSNVNSGLFKRHIDDGGGHSG